MSRTNLPRLSLPALAIGGLSFQARAANFELGAFQLQVDSQISIGASFRTESRKNDYLKHLMKKLGVRSRTQAVTRARELRLL